MSGIGSVGFHSFYISGLIRPENRPQYQTLLGTGRFLFVQLTSCYVFSLGFLIFLIFFPVANAQRGSRWTETQWTSIIGKHIFAEVLKWLRREYWEGTTMLQICFIFTLIFSACLESTPGQSVQKKRRNLVLRSSGFEILKYNLSWSWGGLGLCLVIIVNYQVTALGFVCKILLGTSITLDGDGGFRYNMGSAR